MPSMKDFEKLMQSAFSTEEYDRINFTSEVAAKLVKARLDKNLTQSQLAKMVGLNQSAIARIENQGVIPRIDTIVKIAKALEMELDFFQIGGTRDQEEKKIDHTLIDVVQNLISEIKELREETQELKSQIKELRYESKQSKERWGRFPSSQDGRDRIKNYIGPLDDTPPLLVGGNRVKRYLGPSDDNPQILVGWTKVPNKIQRVKIGDLYEI